MSSSQSRKITAVIAALMFAVMLVSSCSSAACPSGGEYSLTVGEDGLVDVSCSAPGHK